MRWGVPPRSASIEYMENRPSLLESKTMRLPSGDHRGLPVTGALKLVNWRGKDPSSSETHTSVGPDRLEINAILLPSGEYWGAYSSRVDAASLDIPTTAPYGPSSSSRLRCRSR